MIASISFLPVPFYLPFHVIKLFKMHANFDMATALVSLPIDKSYFFYLRKRKKWKCSRPMRSVSLCQYSCSNICLFVGCSILLPCRYLTIIFFLNKIYASKHHRDCLSSVGINPPLWTITTTWIWIQIDLQILTAGSKKNPACQCFIFHSAVILSYIYIYTEHLSYETWHHSHKNF